MDLLFAGTGTGIGAGGMGACMTGAYGEMTGAMDSGCGVTTRDLKTRSNIGDDSIPVRATESIV